MHIALTKNAFVENVTVKFAQLINTLKRLIDTTVSEFKTKTESTMSRI